MDADALSEPTGTGRRYRSKKQRPCDVCRSRKIQCKLQGREAACEMCRKLARNCTFVRGPVTRKYRAYPSGSNNSNNGGHPQTDAQTGALSSVHQQEGSTLNGLSLSHIADSRMAMDVDPLWLPVDVHLSPRTASNLPSMSWWSTLDGTVPPDVQSMQPGGGERRMTSISGNGTYVGVSPNETNRLRQDHRGDPTDIPLYSRGRVLTSTNNGGDDRNYNSNNNNLPSASGGTAPTVVSNESPTTAFAFDIQRNPPLNEVAVAVAVPLPVAMRHASRSSPQHPDTSASTNSTESSLSLLPTWPAEFSLESRERHSSQLIGLSCESDPYLLRHYSYNEHDTFPMYRLHFRNVVDDATMPRRSPDPSVNHQPRPPSGPIPAQFVIADEEIWRTDVEAAERLFSGHSTEESDMELLGRLVPPDLASRLLKL